MDGLTMNFTTVLTLYKNFCKTTNNSQKLLKCTVLKLLSPPVKTNRQTTENLIYRKQGKGTFVSEAGGVLKKQVAIIVYHSDNPYYSKVVKGIVQKMSSESFNVFLANSEGLPEKETEHIKRLINSVDAFIVSPSPQSMQYSEGVKFIIDCGIPLTLVTSTVTGNPLTASVNYVIPDDCSGAFIGTGHLIECGYRNLRFLTTGNINSDTDWERLRGFKFALANRGIDFNESMVVKITSNDVFNGYEADGFQAGKNLELPDAPLGIFACGDPMAIGMMRALKERGVKIPEEVGICGFDDIDLARQWGIELTTIAQKCGEMGEMAAEITLEKLRNPRGAVTHVTVPVELVIRNTTKKLKEALSA